MTKILATIAIVCFALAATMTFADTPVSLEHYKPTEDSYPLGPDEKVVLLNSQENLSVYRVNDAAGQCLDVLLANTKSKFYQRLTVIGCDPDVDHVSFSPSELDGYRSVTFYHKAVQVGRVTLKDI